MDATALRCLALLGLVSGTVALAQDAAIEAIDACLASFDSQTNKSAPDLGGIQSKCPELKTTLEHSPYAAWFPEDWWGPELTTGSLAELRDHMERTSHAPKPQTLDTQGVAAALKSIEDDLQASQVTWWDRLLDWLRSRFRPEEKESGGWLYQWLDELASHQTAMRIIGYTLFGLVVLAALWIVINELMAAGVFGERWQRRLRSPVTGAGDPSHPLSLADVEAGDPFNRPSLLLLLLINTLAKSHDRVVDASVTHRELASRVALDDHAQRSTFARLLGCAERVRYAATLPPRAEVDEVVLDARRLLESLTPPAETSPA